MLSQLTYWSQLRGRALLRIESYRDNGLRAISPAALESFGNPSCTQIPRGEGELSMPDVIAERRDAPRYPLVLLVEVTEIASGIKLISRTSDVSRTGCYVDTANPTSVGKSIRLRLIRGEEALEAGGRVVYITPGLGMGIRFDEDLTKNRSAVLDKWLSETANSL
jgi:hypothetical protein